MCIFMVCPSLLRVVNVFFSNPIHYLSSGICSQYVRNTTINVLLLLLCRSLYCQPPSYPVNQSILHFTVCYRMLPRLIDHPKYHPQLLVVVLRDLISFQSSSKHYTPYTIEYRFFASTGKEYNVDHAKC